jgi:hypothetical protein
MGPSFRQLSMIAIQLGVSRKYFRRIGRNGRFFSGGGIGRDDIPGGLH